MLSGPMPILGDPRVRSMHTTSGSLLERLRNPNEQEAWNRFADLYTPLLYYWLRRLGLAENDAADLIQEVFVILVTKLPNFEYRRDGTFRGWLRTLTINKYREVQRRKKLPIIDSLADVPAKEVQGQHEESEYRTHLVKQALVILKDQFPPSTWQYFDAYVIAGRDPQEVANQFGISIGTVYTAKSKVLARLREELAGLLE
jgi:RNA polymerase sigma-70 factor, ECF subfamily